MAATAASVGPRIRALRQTRGLSQFELASRAGFSVRHVSFIETGRSQPSREAVLALGEVLGLSLRDRNRLLEAAGFARVYRETPLSADEMAHMRGMMQFILDRHMPYAAIVVDRCWNCLLSNRAADQFFAALMSPALIAPPFNIMRGTFHPAGSRRWIVGWPALARHLLTRAEVEWGSGGDTTGAALLAEMIGYAGESHGDDSRPVPHAGEILLPRHIRTADFELRLFSAIMTVCRPLDITMQELRIETFFPADEESERCWHENFGVAAVLA